MENQNYLCIDKQYQWLPIFDWLTVSTTTLSGLLFASSESEGRTEEPTARRKQKEREKGRVAKTPEIPNILVAMGGLLVIFFTANWVLKRIYHFMTIQLGQYHSMGAYSPATLLNLLMSTATNLGWMVAPVLIVVTIMAIVGNVSQVGILFSLKPLQIDFKRIQFSLSGMMRKVFFSKQIAFNLFKTLVKVTLLGCMSYFIIHNDFTSILKSTAMNATESLKMIGYSAIKLSLILLSILFILSIPDYFFQKREFIESIKMTKQEIKEEMKETEGDPLVKQRQKTKLYEYSKRHILQQVQHADVVITNPTHFAVALRYNPEKEDAPRLLAKGTDHLAFILRNLANRYDIPIIENKPLARELYSNVEENEIVPEEFYRILVDLFLSIESIREKLGQQT